MRRCWFWALQFRRWPLPCRKPPGRLVDLGGHRLHLNCAGKGSPTVVVENGFGDFSFDWILVQTRVSQFTRICTYDRAGYSWSDPGPKPRSFAQINLELRDALAKVSERGPFVLVGHSFGGPVVRNFAMTYPQDVTGMVLVDASFEGQRVGIGGGKTMRLGDGAKGGSIPLAREGNEGVRQTHCARRCRRGGRAATRSDVQRASAGRAEVATLGAGFARDGGRGEQPARMVGGILREMAS